MKTPSHLSYRELKAQKASIFQHIQTIIIWIENDYKKRDETSSVPSLKFSVEFLILLFE